MGIGRGPGRGTRRRARTAIAAAAAVLALALTPAAGAASALPAAATPLPPRPAATAIPTTDTVEPAPCPMDVPEQDAERVRCGILTVPERRDPGADPARVIRLPFAIVASTSADPAADPLVFPTSGGPGGRSLSALWLFLGYAGWATDDRDVILLEQRGDALSDPTLACPETGPEAFIVDGRRLAGKDAAEVQAAGLTACRDRLVAAGVDLSAYTSAASAADLADLRTALGYDRWNLYGVSYGARLSLTAMRDRPEGLRAVVLDGAYPPNLDSHELRPAGFVGAVDALIAACAADADCGTRYPRLRQQLLDALDRAARTPYELTVRDPANGGPVTIALDDRDLAYGLFNALYDAGSIRILPFVIDRLAQGDDDVLVPLAQQNLDAADAITAGQNLSIECAEEYPFESVDEMTAAYGADPLAEHLRPDDPADETADCGIWGVPALSDVETQPVTSAIPTILMVGGYDPIAPLAWSEAAAVGLSDSRIYVFPTMSHGSVWQSWVDGCPASIAQQFLTDPTAEPDASCISAMAPTDFLTTSDIRPTSAVYRAESDLVQGRQPLQAGFAIGALAVFVLTLVYAAAYALLRAARRTEEAPAGSVLTATTASGGYLVFAALLTWIVLSADPLVLGFGIPPLAWLVFLLPMAALAIAVLLVVLLVLAWRRDEGSRLHRIVFSITAVAAIAFGVWLLVRGLLIV